MARIVHPDAPGEDTSKGLARSLQSGHVNFLIGSGASMPAIPAAGAIEKEIAALILAGDEAEAQSRMYDFLASVQDPMNALITGAPNANNALALKHYNDCLGIIDQILAERRTTLLPRQATIFTTNYDLFIERASASYPSLKLNDGFNRAPNLDGRMPYSSRTYFNTTFNTGNLFNYKVEIPCVNLVKLHGSLSWQKDKDEIVFHIEATPLLPADKTSAQTEAFITRYSVILPQATKFRTTVLDRTYYELLRIYANELDRENALLIAFGFSFEDEHILDITKRALKNPTLRLVVFAYDESAKLAHSAKFDGHNNVLIVAPPAGSQIGFEQFNQVMRSLLPR